MRYKLIATMDPMVRTQHNVFVHPETDREGRDYHCGKVLARGSKSELERIRANLPRGGFMDGIVDLG